MICCAKPRMARYAMKDIHNAWLVGKHALPEKKRTKNTTVDATLDTNMALVAVIPIKMPS